MKNKGELIYALKRDGDISEFNMEGECPNNMVGEKKNQKEIKG